MEAPAAAAPPPVAARAAPPAPAAAAPAGPAPATAPAAAAPAPAPAPHAPVTVADVVAATHVGAKRRRAGLAPPPPAPAMDQVRDAPPSGTVESDYETIAGMRYKEMAASKGKPFPFKHAWAILQTFDKWKLRDQETAPKKSAMLRMDDSEDEEKERNLGKPEGTKKGKQRVKMEGEASSLREKMEQMMKASEELTRKTLETKILITEKKKEVKLAQVEAKHEEAKRKADLEERMIKVKEAKLWKELMVEEKEHMMMSKKDMDQEQLQWWKDYKEDIAERKRIFRGASSTL
ncbi:DNA mismatch repair protein Msh6-1 [Hordeum vulgare]|nr:DNA mismatch repair protein Msh6-1 [Hordeum vulgare]